MLHSISAITLNLGAFDASCDAVQRLFGYRLLQKGTVDDTMAAGWRAPRAAGRRVAEFVPARGEAVTLRYVESIDRAKLQPFRRFGWNAVELHVGDVRALANRLQGSAFEILGGPRDLLGNGSAVALQVCGPSGEVFYLTTISGDRMQATYGAAECDVGRAFIAVLGASDVQQTLDFYRPFAAGVPRPRKFAIRGLANAHGLDPDTKFPIASVNLRERYRIEVDGYPQTAMPATLTDGDLPSGIAIVSCRTTNAAHAGRLLTGPDGERLDIQADVVKAPE